MTISHTLQNPNIENSLINSYRHLKPKYLSSTIPA